MVLIFVLMLDKQIQKEPNYDINQTITNSFATPTFLDFFADITSCKIIIKPFFTPHLLDEKNFYDIADLDDLNSWFISVSCNFII